MLDSLLFPTLSRSSWLQRRNIVADERSKAIETALSQLEKQFGKGSVMRLGAKEAIVPISVKMSPKM